MATTRADAALRGHPHVHWQRPDLGRARSTGASAPALRIVSLVPSLSEALVSLGLGGWLVGVTEYCVHPAGAFASLPRLGGTKDADVDAIAAVQPDLVIANQEENTPRVVRKLADRGIDVWVTYPRTVREGAALLRELAGLGASDAARARVVGPVFDALEEIEAAVRTRSGPRPRVFCPIWRDPWMTIARGTYIHDLIELCGGQNPFACGATGATGAAGAGAGVEAEAGVGGEAEVEAGAEVESEPERRYPIVELAAVERARPDVILLPDEPYAFAERDREVLRGLDCPAARLDRIHLIDGTLVSWYGPRIAESIRVLAPFFAIGREHPAE